MGTEDHANSERLASEAQLALRAGERQRAWSLYARAGALEGSALDSVPPEKQRTRGILAVSSASLFYKAREWVAAERIIFRCLADTAFPRKFAKDLRDLLEVVWDERVLAEEQHAQYSGDGFVVSMRGGLVGFGSSPLDQFLHTFDGLRNLFYRVTEWVNGVAFRKKGLPSEEIRELFKARTTQPSPGSFRFRIRLVEPQQLQLFDKPLVEPAEIAGTLFEFVARAAAGDERGLEQVVADREYRTAMLKLLRNVSPDGKRLNEIQLHREGELQESVSVFANVRQHIRDSLGKLSPAPPQAETFVGTLRALDLDKQFIDLIPVRGEQRERFYSSEVILDDVVGPMVNQRVMVTGIVPYRGKKVFRDIELQEAPP
jgi:hypothetical protein